MKKTALLLSGGIDSSALCFWKKPDISVFIDYGQRAAIAEKKAATAISRDAGIRHIDISVNLDEIGMGSMSNRAQGCPGPTPEWWPFRNQALITIAAMKIASLGYERIQIATVRGDDAHRDGSLEFVQAMDSLLRIQEGGIRVEAPAIAHSSYELVKLSKIPLESLLWTHSCHVSNHPCGSCRGCLRHAETIRMVMQS